jgi:hypothetical protein
VPRVESLEDRLVPSTLTVTNALDNGSGSLRNAINTAKSDDIIVFASSLDGQTITLSDALTINTSLTIKGYGLVAISGNDTSRIFSINEGLTVYINGLTLTHGRAGGNTGGGAILNVGSTLTLAHDVFSCNVAVGSNSYGPRGGAIVNDGTGALTVTDSTFIDNRADNSGNTSRVAEGGAIANAHNGSSATVIRCTFTGNQAIGNNGGALDPNTLGLGSALGGALFIEGAGSALTVRDSTFTGNQAVGGSGGDGSRGNTFGFYIVDSAEGGAISFGRNVSLALSGSTFAYNQALGGSNATGASEARGVVGSGAGGAVAGAGSLTITSCTFLGNAAVGGSGNTGGSGVLPVGAGFGGGINCAPNTLGPASVTVSSCTFTNNRAVGGAGNTGGFLPGDGWGGGLSNFDGWTATVTGCTFTGNQAIGGPGADGLGGALANILGCTLTVSGCTLSGNQATGGAGAPGGNGGNGLGGGLYNDATSTLSVTSSTVTSNQATGGAAGTGGNPGQGIGGGAYFATGGTVTLDSATLAGIYGNAASTSNNDLFGVFTISM